MRRNRAQRLLAVSACLVMAIAGTACGGRSSSGTPPSSPGPLTQYPLPSDGWASGDPALTALTSGDFHAALVGTTACAWLGDGQTAFLWPEGYKVSFKPIRLINAAGTVVATGGQHLDVGGGLTRPPEAQVGRPCEATAKDVWAVEGPVQ